MSNKKRIQKKRKSIEQKIFFKKYNVRFSDVKVNKEYINLSFQEVWDLWVETPRTELRYEVEKL